MAASWLVALMDNQSLTRSDVCYWPRTWIPVPSDPPSSLILHTFSSCENAAIEQTGWDWEGRLSAPKGVIVDARRVMEEGLTLRCEEDRLLRIGFCVAARWFMLCRRIWIAHLPAARDLFIHQPGYLWQGYYGVVGAGADLLFWRGASLSPVYALNATMSDRFLFCQARVFIPAHASIHPSILSLSRRPTPCRCPL